MSTLENIAGNEFLRVSYTDAIEILTKSGKKFEFTSLGAGCSRITRHAIRGKGAVHGVGRFHFGRSARWSALHRKRARFRPSARHDFGPSDYLVRVLRQFRQLPEPLAAAVDARGHARQACGALI